MQALANIGKTIRDWISNQLVVKKMNSPLGLSILVLFAMALAYVISLFELKAGIVILAGLIGLPFVLLCLVNLDFSILLILSIGTMVPFLKKHVDAPFGTALDGLLFVSLFGLLLKQIANRNLNFLKNPVSALVGMWIIYNFLQVLNPWAASRLAWVYTVRSTAGLIILFFVASYTFDSYKKITFAIKYIVGLALVSSLYGLKQEFLGYTNQELAWLYSDPLRLQLIFQWGRLRIFSFFSDPTTYGVFMGYMGTFCVVLAAGPFDRWKRIGLLTGGFLMFMSMVFAGSRTPFVLVPFGFIVFTLLTLKEEIILAMLGFFFLGTLVVMKGSSNAVIYRLQSAFRPDRSSDTMEVRFKNQKLIQPLIHKRPVGVGLGSTGVWAKRFTPNSFLASFAHDSGFVRIAVEMGWLGLILYMSFLFTLIRSAIYYYLRVRNQKIKAIYLAISVILIQLTLASYPQEVLTLIPTSIVFYIFTAVVVRLKDFDDTEDTILELDEDGKIEGVINNKSENTDLIPTK